MRTSAKRQRVAGSASFARARWFSRLSSPLVASISAFLDVTDHLSLGKADRNTSSACRTARSWAPALDFSRAKDVGSAKWVADWNCRPLQIAIQAPRMQERRLLHVRPTAATGRGSRRSLSARAPFSSAATKSTTG
jgi:hypothetical protein